LVLVTVIGQLAMWTGACSVDLLPKVSGSLKKGDLGNVFRYAASFLTCYLDLFGRQFKTWSQVEVEECWQKEAQRADSRA
jgi:hypothetical protein